MTWFYRYRTPIGIACAKTDYEPDQRRADGSVTNIVMKVKLPNDLAGYSLDALEVLYPYEETK